MNDEMRSLILFKMNADWIEIREIKSKLNFIFKWKNIPLLNGLSELYVCVLK